MATHPEDERRRLSKLYGDMSEGELREVAEEAPRLTEVARQMLAEVIARRGLDIRLADSIPFDEVELQELVTVRTFRDLPEALLAKGALEAAGIECHLADENMVRLNWFISGALGAIKLRVKKEDVQEAQAVLEEPIPETFEVEGIGAVEQPRCPRCGSLDIAHQSGLDKRFALPALWVGGIPIPVTQNDWKCQSCGAEWQGGTR
jgi:Putative prokaryotic signal transducing protein